MRKTNIASALCLISAGAVVLSSAPTAAQTDDQQIQVLVQDINGYFQTCFPTVTPGQPSPPTPTPAQCTNMRTSLQNREKALNLTDADLAKRGVQFPPEAKGNRPGPVGLDCDWRCVP
ncbi:MAG: hypothetical protein ABR878_01465 [Roseiarcus sp.]|jgi:hypothetical protein